MSFPIIRTMEISGVKLSIEENHSILFMKHRLETNFGIFVPEKLEQLRKFLLFLTNLKLVEN